VLVRTYTMPYYTRMLLADYAMLIPKDPIIAQGIGKFREAEQFIKTPLKFWDKIHEAILFFKNPPTEILLMPAPAVEQEQIVQIEKTPSLTQTQHCDVWGIGIPGNVFKVGRPFQKLWKAHVGPDKRAALPLGSVQKLLLDYWSRKGSAPRAPKSEAQVRDIYVKKGFAKESQSLSV
jgi:hypothetical protein